MLFSAQRKPQPSTPLAHTELQVTLTDLVAEYVLRHHFRNTGTAPIEAVFSFPVPLDAAFLGMQATLGGETVMAQIQPQHQASRTYGDAIAQGHSAVLLSQPEPGVLCTSLGNLLPGEQGVVELRFATAVRVADRQARFSLPLVHRPRYGQWRLEQLETPTHDFAVEHPLSAQVRVQGLLAGAPVTCHSHAARFAVVDGALVLDMAHAQLDRDLVLSFDLPADLPPRARLLNDGAGTLGLVSFVLPPAPEAALPLDLCLVLDCSGSMAGDAIEQSRAATLAVVSALGPDDRVQVLRFGNEVETFLKQPMLATPQVCRRLHLLVRIIDADLGGTNMGAALENALAQLGPGEAGRARAVIMVTDGAVQPGDLDRSQAAAMRAGVRLFVVAVGSSAGTEVLQPLAEATGATLERAVPSEPIDAGVMRQFRRARQAGPVALEVTWPQRGAMPVPVGNVYAGDAVQLAAALSAGARGAVSVSAGEFNLTLDLGERQEQPAMRALCGMQRYRAAPSTAREQFALAYGLLTPETSAVLVRLRAEGEQGDALPEIVQVRQMVPEGMVACPRVMHTIDGCALMEVMDAPVFSTRPPSSSEDEGLEILRFEENAPDPQIPLETRQAALRLLFELLSKHVVDPAGRRMSVNRVFEEAQVTMPDDLADLLNAAGVYFYEPVHALILLDILADWFGSDALSAEVTAAVQAETAERKHDQYDEYHRLRTAIMRYITD